jgi:hypothetical protein
MHRLRKIVGMADEPHLLKKPEALLWIGQGQYLIS